MLLKPLVALVTCILLATVTFAADGGDKPVRYRVKTLDGLRIDILDGKILEEEIRGSGRDGSPVSVPRDEIYRLQVHKGNHAGTGLAIGGAAGLLIFGWAVIATRDKYTNQIDGPNVIPLLFGSVGGSVLVGMTIGVLVPRWDDIDLEEGWSQRLSIQPTSSALTLVLRF